VPIITHVYSAKGNYTVTLNVTDSEGLSNSVSKTVKVGLSPVASFTYSPTAPYVGDIVTFNASDSYDPDGYIVSYLWDFGDGSLPVNKTTPTTTHIYVASGNCTVVLSVTDNEGISGTTAKIATISRAPVAVFTHDPDFPIVGETVTFNASKSYDPNGFVANYTWNFGDGNITTVAYPVLTHIYAVEGNYLVTLKVTDNGGYTDTTSDIVGVRNYPTAAFTYTPDYPIAGKSTSFDASSSSPNGGVIIGYFWDFGDGTPSANVTNPIITHVYTAVGNYTVTLTVTDSEGLTGVISHTLKVRDYPKASFVYSPEFPLAGETVTFDASSSTPNHGAIASYKWNFGDDNVTTVTTSVITHIYSKAENYTAILTVTDSEGLNDSTSCLIIVGKAPPIASFTYSPGYPVRSETVVFNASGSYDPDGLITSYVWDFGDGNITIVTTRIVSHVYADVGNYTVVLDVTDNDYLTNATSRTVRVRAYPVADFIWSPSEPEVYKPATFDASSSIPDGGVIVSYEWDFGDGNITTGSDPIIVHNYSTFGYYTVTLNVTDSEGLWDIKSETLKVIAPPKADFVWSPTIPRENETVTFNASISVPNGGIIALYEWDFGDGTPPLFRMNYPIATHQFTTCGNYTVTLTVTDSEYLNDTVSKIIAIGASPNASFTWFPEHPQTHETITFNASMSNPNGGTIISYEWNFGDGNVTTVTDPIVSHYYTTLGDYIVTLNVTDNEGLWDTESNTVSVVAAVGPHADFTWSPPSPYVNETIVFNASASTPNGGMIVSYEWDFGDGKVLIMSDPIAYHSYLLKGNYTVSLNVTDNQGLWSRKSKIISVLPPGGPTAAFVWYPSSPTPNQTVTFDASGSLPGWNGTHHPPILTYTWDFGDGNITSLTAPVIYHLYSQPGNYTVMLTVVDSGNQSNTVSHVVEVLAAKRLDINNDGIIDITDIYLCALAFGTTPGSPGWNPRCDVNNDGIVDITDTYLIAMHYGEDP